VYCQTKAVNEQSIASKYWEIYLDAVKLKTDRTEKKQKEDQLCMGNNYLSNVGFSDLSKQLFAKVIVGADGLPKEGTATSVAIDDETSKIGGNISFSPGKRSKNMLCNIGISGTASGSQLNFFSENEYQKGFKITGGVNRKIHSSVFYYPDSCQKFVGNRDAYFISLIKKISDYEKVNAIDLIARIQTLRDSLSPLKHKNFNEITYLARLDTMKKKLADMNDSLTFLATYVYQFPEQEEQQMHGVIIGTTENYPKINADSLTIILNKELGAFELKNAITSGYTMGWLNLSGSFANSSFNIFDTSVTKNFSEATKKESYSTWSVNFSYNAAMVTKRLMIYGYAGVTLGKRYALEDIIIENDSLVGKSGIYVPSLSVKALDVSHFAEAYNKGYHYFSLQAGTFMFFGESKIFGFEAYSAVRIKIKSPDLIDYKPTYTVRFGPLFSLTKEKGVVSNGTLGLLLESSDFTPSRKNFDDRLNFAVRLSIPFSNLKHL
jgi:hypothetical protein